MLRRCITIPRRRHVQKPKGDPTKYQTVSHTESAHGQLTTGCDVDLLANINKPLEYCFWSYNIYLLVLYTIQTFLFLFLFYLYLYKRSLKNIKVGVAELPNSFEWDSVLVKNSLIHLNSETRITDSDMSTPRFQCIISH